MKNNNQYWETNELEVLVDLNNSFFENTVDENGMIKNQDSPPREDEDSDNDDREDEELEDDDVGDDSLEEEDDRDEITNPDEEPGSGDGDQPDIIDVEESSTDLEETDIDSADQSETNDRNMEENNINPNSTDSEENNLEDGENRRSVDDNGQRINWDNPEISETDNMDDPEIADRKEGRDQPDKARNEKEVPDDPSIRDLYDTDLNASTIHSSNADKTFGDDKHNQNTDQKNNRDNQDRIEGENES